MRLFSEDIVPFHVAFVCRVDGERWCKGSQNLFVWTVNDKEEKLEFARRGIPFFTDSPIRDNMPEAWGPPSVPSYKRPLIALLVAHLASHHVKFLSTLISAGYYAHAQNFHM